MTKNNLQKAPANIYMVDGCIVDAETFENLLKKDDVQRYHWKTAETPSGSSASIATTERHVFVVHPQEER